MMFQGIDTLEQMNGFAISDVLDVLENASDDLRLVEAFWLPAGQKLVFLDERDAKYVECACALWVSIEGWLVRYSQINDILNSHPIRIGGKISDRVLVYNAHASQRDTTAMYGPVTRVRILCR